MKVESATEIKAKTAAGAAGKDEVVVSYANGVGSTGGSLFTYVAPPTVTSISPVEGSTAGGTAVKIKGTGFVKSPKVVIGAEATSVVVVSETEITAKTAAGSAGKAEVVVSNAMGSSSGSVSFTYATPPTVTKVEPAEGTTLGGTAVTIKGTGFAKTATVTIGKAATSVVWVSETELTAKTAAGTAGSDEVIVTNPGPAASSSGIEFTYVAPPTVTSVTPASGSTLGGSAIVVKGTGFVSGAKVKIGTSEATGVKVESATEIKATTAAGAAGKDEVVVSDSKGVSSGGVSFSYVAPPAVVSISPEEGSTAGGTTVKIKGTGFLKGSTVTIGKAATSVTWVSETEVTAKTAAGTAGEDEVVVTDEIAASTGGPSFTYVTPPSVTKVEPAEGTTLGGTSVVITGTGFVSGAKVKIGSVEATGVKVESATEIKAKTAAGAAGKDEVVVSYANGVGSTGGSLFTYVAPPTVSSISPVEGSTAGGTAVKIKGTGFVKSPKVVIGAEATSVVVVSETEITAKTAAGSAGKAEVVVSNAMGSSSGRRRLLMRRRRRSRKSNRLKARRWVGRRSRSRALGSRKQRPSRSAKPRRRWWGLGNGIDGENCCGDGWL